MDPQLYAGFTTAADGQGKRVPFLNHKEGETTANPPRYLPQELRGTEMFGGLGSDYFALGNPGNLDPASIANGYDYYYRISGNADEFKNKEDNNFGLNASPDIYEVSLNYAGENWTNTVTSAPGDPGSSSNPSATDLAGLGISGFSAILGIAGAWGANFPGFNALAAVGNFVVGIASLFKPSPKEAIETTNQYYSDPIGNWRQKISIQDWDPSDSMVIRVDPGDRNAQTSRRWDAITFSFKPGSDSSNNSYVDLTYQLAKQSEKTLFRLENIKDSPSSGAWYGWDFYAETPGFKEIDQANLGFFGQIEMLKGVEAEKDADLLTGYTDQYGFEVKQGTHLFRWNDTTLRNDMERLGRMQSRSERIVAQLDTMTLGYYWDNQFKGNVSSTTDTNPKIEGLGLDKEASKLWIRTGPSTWESHSYASLEKSPELQVLAKHATPQWFSQPPTKSKLLTGLESLDTEMSGTLDDLVPAMPGARAPRVEARGKLLKSHQFDLTDLNTVKDIVIEGGENPYDVIYHKPQPAASKNGQIKMLKTIIDNNTVFPTYGLSKQELLLEERKFNEDLDANGLISRMAPTSATG